METKTVNVSFKAGPEDGLAEGEFLVYPSTFTKTPDSYGDIVAPGAFAETLQAWKESGLVLPGLYGHRMDDPDYNVAFAKDSGEDEHGWWVKGQFDLESPKGPTVYRLVKGKRLNQLSFAYDVQDEGQVELEDGTKANELRKLKVYEFSFVPVGANQDTSVVAVKATAEMLVDGIKEGRTLSAKNEGDIRSAVELLNGVLAAVDPDAEEPKAAPVGRRAKAAAPDETPIQDAAEAVEAAVESVNAASEALAAAWDILEDLLPGGDPDEAEEDQEEASGSEPGKSEEPSGVKDEDPMRESSADAWAQIIRFQNLKGA